MRSSLFRAEGGRGVLCPNFTAGARRPECAGTWSQSAAKEQWGRAGTKTSWLLGQSGPTSQAASGRGTGVSDCGVGAI